MRKFSVSLAIFIATFSLDAGCSEVPPSNAGGTATHVDPSQEGGDQAAAETTVQDWFGLGDRQLRAGQCQDSVNSFEEGLRRRPAVEPHLWQYGIALFFVKRYADAKALFEKHRRVNPNDVENAAWHYLCVAKATDVDQARKILLPAPDDHRPPMAEILDRLAGGDFKAIEQAVDRLSGLPGHQSAKFYGDLYIGLVADAEGDSATAKAFMAKAAGTNQNHYMADVARVYHQHLSSSTEPLDD